MIEFPVSGVETYWWFPPLVAFAVSYASSLGGLSGAFMLLPFQISILGFTGPAVTPTNLIFNIFATPGGAYRFFREGRMVWPLAGTIVVGTIPGVIIGALIRVNYLPDPTLFKLFAGTVLLFIGTRLFLNIYSKNNRPINKKGTFRVENPAFTFKHISYSFNGDRYNASTWQLFALALVVGTIGGTYGIGGGALIVPILVSVFGLPVYTVSGAALLETFATSLFGVISYTIISYLQTGTGQIISPDWYLGGLLGIGGFAGIYLGARTQKHLPSGIIKFIIAICILFVAGKYILGYFL